MNYVLYEFDANLKKILDEGMHLDDRTGVGCKFLPGVSCKIDISSRIPVPTRRKTVWSSMLKEYLWFLTGSDNISDLNALGSKVWDSWRDDPWTDKKGFERGSIGFGYGPNLINYGADLGILNKGKGFNQIDYVLNELRTNRNSRRILFSFWRPDKITESKLPPCHLIYQFIPEPDETGQLNNLSCCMYCRSQDYFVGTLSTNLQGAAFFTHMIAQQVGMRPKSLYHTGGHCHIYDNHIDGVKEYLSRPAPNSPILTLNHKPSIYEYTADDFVLSDYNPAPSIKIPIAV